jgi:uncharacterized protein YndB with AHSA1/START domain
MPRLLACIAATALLLAATGTAGAIEVTQTVTTSASPKKVWSLVGAFDGIAAWLPGAASSPADKGDKPGSVRVITLKAPGNPTVTEVLTAHHGHSYSYKITAVDPKVLPVTNYSSTISVAKSSDGATITWTGDFEPAAGTDENAAAKAVASLYRAGLDNIKTLSEK